jgi:hypothetical protein
MHIFAGLIFPQDIGIFLTGIIFPQADTLINISGFF